MLGWTMVFALLAAVGAGMAWMGGDPASPMRSASIFFSLLCVISFASGAIGSRTR